MFALNNVSFFSIKIKDCIWCTEFSELKRLINKRAYVTFKSIKNVLISYSVKIWINLCSKALGKSISFGPTHKISAL